MMTVEHGPATWEIPPIGVGTASWGPPYPPVPQEQALELVHFALTAEKAFFDTAPAYAGGLSEQWLGQGLQGADRQRFIVSSKAGHGYGDDGKFYWDWSRDGILRSGETSRKHLGIAQIDILHLHDLDYHYKEALSTAYPTLLELRQQGLIRAIGAGVTRWQTLLKLVRDADFDCFLLAGRYTLLEQGALELLDSCQQKGIAIFLGGVYNSGILATGAVPGARYEYRPAPPVIMERVRCIGKVCTRFGVPLQAAALQFPLAHPAVKTLVIGSSTAQEHRSTLSYQCLPIPQEMWQELRAEGLLNPRAPVPGSPPCG
jgi:D-threo-aldose 1-dehydrogenase